MFENISYEQVPFCYFDSVVFGFIPESNYDLEISATEKEGWTK